MPGIQLVGTVYCLVLSLFLLSVKVRSTSGNCTDKYEPKKCEEQKHKNRCDPRFPSVLENCKKTCNVCSTAIAEPPAPTTQLISSSITPTTVNIGPSSNTSTPVTRITSISTTPYNSKSTSSSTGSSTCVGSLGLVGCHVVTWISVTLLWILNLSQ